MMAFKSRASEPFGVLQLPVPFSQAEGTGGQDGEGDQKGMKAAKAMKAMKAMKGNMRRISWMTTGVDAAVKRGELTYCQTYDGIEEYERALPTNCGEVRFVLRRVA